MYDNFKFKRRVRALSMALGLLVGAAVSAASSPPFLNIALSERSSLQLSAQSRSLVFPQAKLTENARGLALASADLNIDGYPELISAYANGDQGFLAIYQGNKEAYAPSSKVALADLRNGIYPSGFSAKAQTLPLPVAADLIATGDFNADGDTDLVAAKRGDSAIYFLAGSRDGFAKAERMPQPGSVDALVAGEINLPNAAIDLAVAISGEGQASLLVYRDGLTANALRYDLPGSAEALAIGRLDDNLLGDVAVLAGGEISILHGYNQRAVAPNFDRLETLAVTSNAVSFALGDFIWDRDSKTEIALMLSDGSVAFAARGALNTEVYSVAEVRVRRAAQHAEITAVNAWRPGTGGAWRIAESSKAVVGKAMAVKGAAMLRAHLSTEASDDLIVLDSVAQVLKLLTVEGKQRKSYSVNASAAPVAALSMPTSAFVLPSLIVLGEGANPPSILPSVAKAIFTVSKTADTNDGLCNADCSLREAIGAANAAAGADSITLPAGTYTLTIANSGGLNEDNNAQGDLDINDALTIAGAGSATTIIRAGTTTSNGIDKVLAFNPICVSPMATAISGVTVSFGRNTQPTSAPDFSYTGGGMDWCGTGNSSMSVTNSVFDSNTNTLGYGGGINLDSFAANGSVSITGSTISNNRTLSTLGNNTGGGVNLFADQHGVTFTNCIITSNTTTGEGGGLFVRHTNGGAVLVQATNISNNNAASRGGGISNTNLGASTFTINQDSTVVANISQGLTGLAAEGGGIYSSASNTTNINEVTITNNSASGVGAPEQRGGGGIATGSGTVNVTFSRIVGNTATGLGGSGIHKDLNPGTTTATNNWWGCNAGAASAPCDRAVSAGGAGVTLTSTPHLVLSHAASPNSIVVGQTSALTAGFLTNSAASAVALANLDALIGTTHAHSSPVLGAHSATQTAIQATGTATATFTATGVGAGSSDSVVDSQTQTVAITIGKANTTTTITSDTPDPSVVGGVVAVNYAVAVTAPGAGTPTGNVTVTVSGGAETCTGTVAAGTCNITLTLAGSRTLTATYAGDTNFNGSAVTEPHTVNNPTSVSIAVALASVSEDGATNLVYTVTRDAILGSATIVNLTTSGTAASGTDYTGGVATATILSGATTATITIDPTVDGAIEADETVILTIAAGTGYTVGTPASATGTILNDDLPSATIAVLPASVNEDGAPSLIYTVTLNQASFSALSIVYIVSGTATNGTDYATITSPLVIPAGNTTGTITVNPAADATIEADETVTLTLAAGSGYTVGAPAADTGTILNDDLPNLTINDVNASEGNVGTTNFAFTVSLSAPAPAGGVGFSIATANGTATAGSDYTASNLTSQTIPAGNSAYTFTVLVNGDTLNEASETFFVNVTGVTNANTVDGQGLGTTINDDPLPALSINSVSQVEGNSGTSNAVFTVSLSAASGQDVSVNYATADGTATAGLDYTATSGALTITAGQTSASISVPVLGDLLLEGDETFTVTLSGASNASISTATGTGTIVDDELPSLTINDVSSAEGNSGTQVLNFTVTRTGTTATASSFSFATADNTAISGSDYVAASGTGTIPAGGATGTTTVSITINGDAVFENTESFFVNVTTPVNAVITDNQGIGTITNDDTAPTLAINDLSITEGNSGTQTLSFTVTRTGLTELPTNFTAVIADGTATAPSDYLAALTGSTTIAAGGATGTTTLTATINGDNVVEANETFFVNLSAPSNSTIADNQGIGTINNDDTAGVVVTQSGGSTDVTEGGVTDTYTLVLTSQPTNNVSIALNPGMQVTGATSPVVFTTVNWNIAQTVTVTAVDDVVVEGNHTGTISHTATSSDTNYNNFTVVNVVANITDNDLPSLAIDDVSIAEANGGTQVLIFTVTRTGATPSAVGFNFATADGTATIADNDYVAASGTGTIPSGGATATTTVSVTINDDVVFENSETFVVNLTAPTNALISDGQGVGTITNDDIAPTLVINDVSITEGNSGTQSLSFTVTRTGLTAFSVGFTAATADGTATAPSDYLAALSGSTSIAAGGATGATTLTTTINGDAVSEANETFSVVLSAPVNATIATGTGIGTIDNDDSVGVIVTESGATTDVTEGGATDTYTLLLTSQPTGNVSVALNPGAQVTVATGPVVFTTANWNVAQTVTVTAVDDAAVEGPHTGTISHTVTSSDTAYNNFTVANVAANITDNDLPTLTINDASISEGNSGMQVLNFTVTRTGTTPSAVSFNFATADNTATTAGSDYVAATGTGTIPGGGAMGTTTVSVTINGDALFENNESFIVTLSAASGASIATASAIGTITDDEVLGLSIADVTLTEGTVGTAVMMNFTVSLAGDSSLPVTVDYASNDGTAGAPGDYTAVSGALTFAPGENSKTVAISIVGDTVVEAAETITLSLSNPSPAPPRLLLARGTATGTIINGDALVPVPMLDWRGLMLLLVGMGVLGGFAMEKRDTH